MFKSLFSLLVSLFLSSNVIAQLPIGKDLIDNLATKDNLEKLKAATLSKFSDLRKEYDEESINYAVSLSDNAGMYENEERFRRSQKIIFESIKLTTGTKNSPKDDASNLNEAGEMLFASNKFKLAEDAFKTAIKTYESNGIAKDALYALIISNLGLLYHASGRYNLSEKYTDSALNIRKRVLPAESSPIAASMNNLAVLYKDKGQYNESEEIFNEVLRILEKALSKKSVPYALAINNIAMLQISMGRYAEAEIKLQEALSTASDLLKEKSNTYLKMLLNLAVLYQLDNRLPEAEAMYSKVIKAKEKRLGTSHPDYAHALNLLASLYIDMGSEKYGEAENLLKKSVAIYKKVLGEEHVSYANAITNLGNYYRITGKPTLSEPLLNQALAIRKTTLGELHPEYINSVENIGLLQWQQGKNIEAAKNLKQSADMSIKEIEQYFIPLSENERTKFWDKIRPRFQRFNSFVIHVRKSQPALAFDMYNYQLATKALILNSTNNTKAQILASKDHDLITKYNQWLDAKENLARLYTLSKQQIAEENINLDSLENVANSRERELSVKSTLFAKGYAKPKTSYKNIVEKLNVDEAAVEVIQLQKFHNTLTDSVQYVGLILSKDKAAGGLEVVIMSNGNEMEKKFYSYYKNSIKQKTKDEHSYKVYWEKFEKHLTHKKTIYFSMDGIYNQISLATIHLPSGGYLIDHKNIILLTNTKEIIALKDKGLNDESKSQQIYLAGFPLYGSKGSVEKLPGTKVEIENIKKVLSAKPFQITTYLQEEANEENIKSIKNPKILHIATHGYFTPELQSSKQEKYFGVPINRSISNPLLRSGLLLTDAEKAIIGKSETGILTAYEVSNMMLDNTSLVVLSACETGLGDIKNGEGVYGLQRAFRVAGAESIIMSLWKVNDAATQELMSLFYKNYTSGIPKSKAFKDAQIALREKFKEPYYWGAFVMVE